MHSSCCMWKYTEITKQTRVLFIHTCILLDACASVWCNYINNRRKKPFRNATASRCTKLLQSPDQLWSLIKQGINGLYGDYHYRPLEQSSQNVFLSPQALAQWFSMDYMRPQDMSPHSLNQFLHLPPFNKDWFFFTTLPGTPAHEQNLEYTKLNMYISWISLCWFSWGCARAICC